MATPRIDYTTVDGQQLAYQVVGDGPIDLILVDEWSTPLEGRWEAPAIADRLDRLGEFARIISFDKRGIGLSDHAPVDEVATPELWVRDLVGVADAVGADCPALFGAHEGGPIALLFGASIPERCRALVLANTGPRLTATEGWPFGIDPADWTPDIEGITSLWADGGGGEQLIPATAVDPWWREWYARSRRQQASPSVGLQLMTMLGSIDVRRIAPSVRAATLIVHRRQNPWWPIEGARWLAETIPDAHLVELDGPDNYWWSGAADEIVDAAQSFLVGAAPTDRGRRELITIMFTDIVDSTATATRLCDGPWRRLLDRHDRIVADEVARHGGTILKNLGDGFLIQFGGPAAAMRAAASLHTALQVTELDVRAAIHTGEVERRGDDISGVAVHLAARMLDTAGAGETVTSGVVRGLVAGSGIGFEPRGRHEFKGISESWELFLVTEST